MSQVTGPLQRTILIVDDSPEDRELYRRYLRQDETYTYTILEAALGQQALSLWQQHQPDIILLDYRLPDLDGLALLARLQPPVPQPSLPVIMLTGLGSESIAVQAIKAGAQDYLVKGQITSERLRTAIDSAIDTVQLHRQLQQRTERERVISQITRQIHQTLDLNEILQTTVHEVRQFLQTDRVLIFRLQTDGWGLVTTESVGADWIPLLSTSLYDPCFNEHYAEPFRQGLVTAKPDIHDGSIDPCHVELLANLQVKANLVVPILQDSQLWGMLIVHHCSAPRQWQTLEIDLLKELATQVGIALQQSELYQQVQTELAERRQAEAALRQSEEFKQRIFDSSADCIKILDLEGRLLSMNAGGMCVMEIDDFTPFINSEWTGFWQGEGQQQAKAALVAARAGRMTTFEGYCPTAKGTPKWWEVIVCPILDGSGQVERILSISRNISDRIHYQAERERLLAQEQSARAAAEQANRLKDEFLAVLSHELRSPLNPTLGWIRLLRSRSFEPSRAQAALEVIERNVTLQAQLIDDLLDVSRIMRGKMTLNPTPVNLATVVNAAIDSIQLSAEVKQIHITTSIASDLPSIVGDVTRLQQAIWNILSNAIKFTPAAGQIKVSLIAENTDDIATAKLTVTDTGKGIKPEFLPHLFEYFRQEDSSTTRRFGGLGLGLAIVHQIVELHNGTITASSPGEEQGATFTIRLPLPQQQIDALAIATPTPTTPELPPATSTEPLAGVQILVVDDDTDNLIFYTVALESFGAIVATVSSATAALQYLAEATPDLLLSDIGMPEMSGYELIQQIRAIETTPIPAIALTAYASSTDRELALAAGFQAHLAKPIAPEVLVTTIQQLLVEAK